RGADILLAAALAGAGLPAVASLPAVPDSATTGAIAPSVPGYRAVRECRAAPTTLPDTLRIVWSRGPVKLVTGAGLGIPGRERTGPEGDTTVFVPDAAARASADSTGHCLYRYESPALPQPRTRLYDPADIPVWRPGDSAAPG